jgi:hypothetical protein
VFLALPFLALGVAGIASAQPATAPTAPPVSAPPTAPPPPSPWVQAPPPQVSPPASAAPVRPPFVEEEEEPRRRSKRRPPRPKKLVWKPGEAVPYGYEEQEGPSVKLLVAGLSTAGALWLGSSIYGYVATFAGETEVAPMLIPGIGPFITIATSDNEGIGTFLLALNGMGQVAGITIASLSAVFRDTWLQRIPAGIPLEDSADSARIRVDAGLGRASIALDF